jgi:glycosyl-4,4'-diaponeurosporenoate acyltransferase
VLEYAALYAVIWIFFHFGAGYLAHLMPAGLVAALPAVSRQYGWERTGKIYERLGIRSWKDGLPEAGGLFRGGFAKRRLESHDADYLGRFALETSRAECSHWLTWSLSLTFFAWNPWQVGVVMVIYGALANAPFILVQRYNRARLHRLIQALARRAHRNNAVLPANAVAYEREI